MANGCPQPEEGFTRLANELLEAVLRFPFTLRQVKILFAIARMTYGYRVKKATLSSSKLANMTGIDPGNVRRTLKELEAIGAVSKQHGFKGQVIGISKHYGKWKECCGNTPVLKQHGKRAKTTRATASKPFTGEGSIASKENYKEKENARTRALSDDLHFALETVGHAFQELDPPPADPGQFYEAVIRRLPTFPGTPPQELQEQLAVLSQRLGIAGATC